MSTKKLLVIIGAIAVAIGLVIVVFVGGIIGFALYSVGNSEAATVAKNFLRQNDRLKRDIGEVKDFGSIVTGNINIDNAGGSATLNLKVIGENKTVNSSVQLLLQRGEWHVTGATYTNDAGETIDLLQIYEAGNFRLAIANRQSSTRKSILLFGLN